KDGLVTLLDGLVDAVPDMDWFRILYAYPGYVTDRLIDFMAANPQVLPYLDIPLQHAHPDILRRMKRPANMDWVHRTLEKLRHSLPNVAIRTTFIVGYPGETDLEFQTLLDFTTRVRFDRVGVFEFSFEPGAASEPLGDPVPVRIKADRSQELMSLQRGISHQINQSQVGRTLHVLVEGRDRDTAVGRSYRDAPEIDGLVLFDGPARIGDIVPVRITGALPYDLSGTQVGQH
ncbi:MAG: radical SAM protein, partial [Chloroflexi bacterium]|nr:radical SAM protein [Chloroflexota bacterium]